MLVSLNKVLEEGIVGRPGVDEPRTRSRRRMLWRVSIVGGGLLVATLGLVATRHALRMRADLEDGRRALLEARAAVDDMDVTRLERVLRQAQAPLARALDRSRTTSLRALARVPLLGRSVRGARALVDAGLIAIDAGLEGVNGARVFPLKDGRFDYGIKDGRLDTSPWPKAQPHLARAEELLRRATARIDEVADTWVIGAVADARDEMRDRLAELERFAVRAEEGSRLIPSMLGTDRPRRFLLVVQNLAESRATGGLVGGFALIEADRGKLRLERVASNVDLVQAKREIPMPDWYRERYDIWNARRTWQNATMEADFRVTGPLMAKLFEETAGIRVDGVMATNPIGLAELLGVTGPIDGPRGIRLEPDSFAQLVMSDAYRIFEGPRLEGQRKAFFVEAGALIWKRALETSDVRRAGEALGRAARGRHLMLWSSDPADEAALERLDLAGVFRDDQPFIGVVTQTTTRSKVDYYLRRSPTLLVDLEPDGRAAFRLSLHLENGVPSSGLPREVIGPDPGGPQHAPGLSRLWVNAYLPPSASVRSFIIAGSPVSFEAPPGTPTPLQAVQPVPGALVVSGVVEIPSRTTAEVELTWEQPGVLERVGDESRLALTMLRQPTVAPDNVVLSVAVPSGFRAKVSSAGAAVEGDAVVWRARGDRELRLEMALVRSSGKGPFWSAVGAAVLLLAGLMFVARRRRGRPVEPRYGAPQEMGDLAASVAGRGNGFRVWRRIRVRKGVG